MENMKEATTDKTQELMDAAYNRWQKNHWSQEDFWAQLSPREKVAVYVGNLNNQVCNGGFSQWHFNGYSNCSDELLQILPRLGDASQKVAKMITSVLSEEEEHEDWDEYEDGDWDYSQNWDSQFYTINDAMLEECEAFVSLPDEEFNRKMAGIRVWVFATV